MTRAIVPHLGLLATLPHLRLLPCSLGAHSHVVITTVTAPTSATGNTSASVSANSSANTTSITSSSSTTSAMTITETICM
jgi:hypothetical protein